MNEVRGFFFNVVICCVEGGCGESGVNLQGQGGISGVNS